MVLLNFYTYRLYVYSEMELYGLNFGAVFAFLSDFCSIFAYFRHTLCTFWDHIRRTLDRGCGKALIGRERAQIASISKEAFLL